MHCNFTLLGVSHSQLCPTLCNLLDCSLPGSSVHGILQAKILEWIAIPFSKESSSPRDRVQISCIPGRFLTIWATREAQSKNIVAISKANNLCSCVVFCQVFTMDGKTKPSIYCRELSYKKQRNWIKDLKRILHEMSGSSDSCFHDYSDLKLLASLSVQRSLKVVTVYAPIILSAQAKLMV